MNTQLQTRPSHSNQLHQHEQQPQLEASHQVRRVSPLDRLALHVGLALIAWGRRPQCFESRERRANRVEQALARESRHQRNERTARLLLPIR